jgi:hypothetical protein
MPDTKVTNASATKNINGCLGVSEVSIPAFTGSPRLYYEAAISYDAIDSKASIKLFFIDNDNPDAKISIKTYFADSEHNNELCHDGAICAYTLEVASRKSLLPSYHTNISFYEGEASEGIVLAQAFPLGALLNDTNANKPGELIRVLADALIVEMIANSSTQPETRFSTMEEIAEILNVQQKLLNTLHILASVYKTAASSHDAITIREDTEGEMRAIRSLERDL